LQAGQPHHGSRDILAITPDGEVARCDSCSALHLRFGNALLTFDQSDLRTLRDAVLASRDRPVRRSTTNPERPIELYVGESGAGFAFSLAEMAELDQLLAITEAATADLSTIPEPIRRRIARKPNVGA
jgi:hypothetical protein